MPIGVLINNTCVALGGIIGAVLGKKMPKHLSGTLNELMGFLALGIAATLLVKVHTLGAVVLSVILGTTVGTLLRMDEGVNRFFAGVNRRLFKSESDAEFMSQFTTLLVLCCASGTGIFGSLTEGMTGDRTIIICKAILDFFTVLIFAANIGKFCAIIAIPQCVVFMLMFFLARFISPIMTDVLKADFTAVGGVIELMIGFRILKISKIKPFDALPSMILVFPISYLWNLLF